MQVHVRRSVNDLSKNTHNPLSCVLLLECVSYRSCDALKMEHTVCHFVKNKHRDT